MLFEGGTERGQRMSAVLEGPDTEPQLDVFLYGTDDGQLVPVNDPLDTSDYSITVQYNGEQYSTDVDTACAALDASLETADDLETALADRGFDPELHQYTGTDSRSDRFIEMLHKQDQISDEYTVLDPRSWVQYYSAERELSKQRIDELVADGKQREKQELEHAYNQSRRNLWSIVGASGIAGTAMAAQGDMDAALTVAGTGSAFYAHIARKHAHRLRAFLADQEYVPDAADTEKWCDYQP